MFIFWGAEGTCFYNDAYRRSIGPEHHPSALGQPARQVWDEIWPIIGPQVEQVMSGGGPTWHVDHLVPITRFGRREDVYWTYSFTPIDDDNFSNGIGGVLVVCTETSPQVRRAHGLSGERDRLARLFEQSPTFMAMLQGLDHRFEIANPNYMQLVGHRPIVGKTVVEALPEAVEQGFVALLDSVVSDNYLGRSAGACQGSCRTKRVRACTSFAYAARCWSIFDGGLSQTFAGACHALGCRFQRKGWRSRAAA